MTGTGQLAGRRVVLTGASGGIGRAVAHELAGRSARLVLVGRRRQPLEELAGGLEGGPHRIEVMDVTDESGWTDLGSRLAREGGLDGLVTAAGVLGPVGPTGTWSVTDLRRVLEVNLVGTVAPILALVGLLGDARGSIVTFSGGGATSPLPRFDPYAASKAAVVRLTENMAADLAERRVRVNAVAPGFIATGMHEATLAAGPERAGAAYFDRTRRALGSGGDSPADAAELAAFLLSADAEGITGRLISAVWDPWRDSAFRDRLRREPDLATLRRIDDRQFLRRDPS